MFSKVNAVPVEEVTQDAEKDAISSPSKVNDLASSIQLKKAEMSALKAEVDAMESELIMICGHKDEGSHKFDTEQYIITTTGKLTRKITDLDLLQSLAPQLTRTKTELDLRALKSLATANPMLYKKSLQAIETKPAKTAIKIEVAK